jgi:hypothetical protein
LRNLSSNDRRPIDLVVVEEEAVVKVEVKAVEVAVDVVKAEDHLAVEAEVAVVVEEPEQELMKATTRLRQRERPMSDVLAVRLPLRNAAMPMGVTKERHLSALELEREAEVPSAIVEEEVSRDVIDPVKRKPGSKDVRRVEQWTSQST